MTYEQLKHLKRSAFKRRCGVQPDTFEQMAELLRPALDRRGFPFPRWTVQTKRRRPIATGTGILAGRSHSYQIAFKFVILK